MLIVLAQLALAGAPANGDFELVNPPSWTDVSGSSAGASVQIVEQGAAFGTGSTTIVFPSSTRALFLQNGLFGSLTPAVVRSDDFLVTHALVRFQHYDQTNTVTLFPRFAPAGETAEVLAQVAPSVGAFAEGTADLTTYCGIRGALQFAQNGPSGSDPYTLIDDVTVDTLCDAYIDGDADGHCPLGVDLDGDGDCGDDAEAFATGEAVGDCDDVEPTIYPGAPEIPDDGIDQDCSGADFQPNCFEDVDGDGFGAVPIEGSLNCSEVGEASQDGDCDDDRVEAFPGAQELCNGVDDDCDGTPETEFARQAWPDGDGDGFGDVSASPIDVCGPVLEGVENGDDCDDANPFVSPGEAEGAGDGLDQDCDGQELCFVDADGDTYGSGTTLGPLDCDGFATRGGDCDDALEASNPGATEQCNGLDDDCDGVTDEGFGATLYYPDVDGDGFGDEASSLSACEDPGAGWIEQGGDCDDDESGVNPDADEIRADGVDQDCDGFEACYVDGDGDGHGVLQLAFDPNLTCLDDGYALTDDDCDDEDPEVSPSAEEIPANGVDDDCDGDVDPTVLPEPGQLVYKGGACSTGASPSFALLVLLPWLFRRRDRT